MRWTVSSWILITAACGPGKVAVPPPDHAPDSPAVESQDDQDRLCFAEPATGPTAHPIEGFNRRALDTLLAGVDGECTGIDARGKGEFREEIRIPLDRAECKAAIGRIYFEGSRWVEAARWFRRATLDEGIHETPAYVVRLYIESLRILGADITTSRPACFGVMQRDATRLSCRYCGAPADDDWKQVCRLLQEVRFELHHRGFIPKERDNHACGPGQRLGRSGCAPLPPVMPRTCTKRP